MGLALGQHTSAEEGCSLSVWNSSTGPLGMKPADSKNTLSTLNLSLSGDAPFSAEAVCTLTVPAGNYSFSLVASGLGVNAYAWIDGHLVGRYAQSGVNLIGHDPTTFVRDESMDDVLPIGHYRPLPCRSTFWRSRQQHWAVSKGGTCASVVQSAQ